MKLYEISNELKELEAKIINNDGEVTDNDEMIQTQLEKLLADKTDGCFDYVKSLQDKILVINNRIDELKEIKSSTEKKLDAFLKYVLYIMQQSDRSTLEGSIHKFKRIKPREVVKIMNEDELPVQFLKEEFVCKIDKVGIKKALKAGEEVPGAILGRGKDSLAVR